MDTQRQGNGWSTFVEHWGTMLSCMVALVAMQCALWMTGLRGVAWIWTYFVALAFGVVSVVVLTYAKWPLYCGGRFFTRGAAGIPAARRRWYRLGLVIALADIIILACLIVSHP